jgi:hypothetical protein
MAPVALVLVVPVPVVLARVDVESQVPGARTEWDPTRRAVVAVQAPAAIQWQAWTARAAGVTVSTASPEMVQRVQVAPAGPAAAAALPGQAATTMR